MLIKFLGNLYGRNLIRFPRAEETSLRESIRSVSDLKRNKQLS